LALVERFYEPVSGEILVDGKNIRDFDHNWYHRQIAIVTQEPVLFATSIKRNILYGVDPSKRITEHDIIKASKAANAHDFIMKLPDKYNTLVGERGVSLSGGQKQRIAIAV
jgi:ABC-type multidrug transport system fused ATPase/permease subunit